MKRHLLTLTLTLTLFSGPTLAGDPGPALPVRSRTETHRPTFAPGELLVGFRETAGARRALREDALASAFDLEALPSPALGDLGVMRFRVRGMEEPAALAARIAALPDVAFAEPNAVFTLAAVPTDPLYAGVDDQPTDLQRWAFGGIGDNHVLNAEPAWDVTRGSSRVVIAVIDSGTDTDNPELTTLWVNRHEVPGNNLDDDHNGYVDDVNGFDFAHRRGDVNPDLGDGLDNDEDDYADNGTPHGTLVASIAVAAHDNGIGMAGAAPGCSLMTVKVFPDDGGVTADVIAEAVKYAADNGADVINMSFASGFSSQALRIATDYAISRKAILVASAGNGGFDGPLYPANFPNVISVGGSGSGIIGPEGEIDLTMVDRRWEFSQYGYTSVTVVAPAVVLGSSVVSVWQAAGEPELTPGQTVFEVVEGTSFAAPFASGLAALVVTRDLEINGQRTLLAGDVKALLTRTAVKIPPSFLDFFEWDANGRINFAAALDAIPGASAPAPAVTDARFVKAFKKELLVFGDGFSQNSKLEINGILIERPVTFSYVARQLKVTGGRNTLKLNVGTDNEIVVIERGVRSPVYSFRL